MADTQKKEHRPPIDANGAAAYTGLRENYLAKLRCTGGGPVFIKIAGKVRYAPDDLDAWLASSRRNSTSASRAA